MKVYITAIGSGNTLNYPHQKNFEGVLAILENSKEYGLYYYNSDKLKNNNGSSNLSQDKIFELKFKGTDYKFKELIKINTWETTYEIGKKILLKLEEIKKEFPNVKFHIETSAGYKKIGHILTLISYIKFENISKLTFLSYENREEILPNINIKLYPKEKEILKEFKKGIYPTWNGKINMNKYVLSYNKNRKYIYKVLKKAKDIGFLNEKNKFTDFGNLFLEFN